MAERRMWRSQRGEPRNMGPTAIARPVTLTTPHWCMHWPVVKCVQTNACPFRSANLSCTSVFPSDNCCNQGPTRSSTVPRITTNVRETIKESQDSAPILCQAIALFVFRPDTPAFSTSVLPRGDKWPTITARADTSHSAPVLTETSATNSVTQADIGRSKINSNSARPTDGQTASPSPSADLDSDVALVASIG